MRVFVSKLCLTMLLCMSITIILYLSLSIIFCKLVVFYSFIYIHLYAYSCTDICANMHLPSFAFWLLSLRYLGLSVGLVRRLNTVCRLGLSSQSNDRWRARVLNCCRTQSNRCCRSSRKSKVVGVHLKNHWRRWHQNFGQWMQWIVTSLERRSAKKT